MLPRLFLNGCHCAACAMQPCIVISPGPFCNQATFNEVTSSSVQTQSKPRFHKRDKGPPCFLRAISFSPLFVDVPLRPTQSMQSCKAVVSLCFFISCMDLDPRFSDLVDVTNALQRRLSDFRRKLETLQNDAINEEASNLERMMASVQRGVDGTALEREAHRNSWQHPIPRTPSWAKMYTTTNHYVTYQEAYPHPPSSECRYHKDRNCKNVFNSTEPYTVPLTVGWLSTRNHIWAPCGACMSRTVQHRGRRLEEQMTEPRRPTQPVPNLAG